MELLLGCGHNREKRAYDPDNPGWRQLITLDMSPEVKPDLVANLDDNQLPFKDSTFDEIHAYEVLEHQGSQGDFKFFFAQFDEFARVLKDAGLMCFSCPKLDSRWVWADPGHRRYIGPDTLVFLDRDNYAGLGKTVMADYRPFFKSNWRFAKLIEYDDSHCMVLVNRKEQ
jgi:predicted SAM-dependent methyltransferase